ncbi:MAG: type II toxin-antitoxin system HicA family toxin [Bacteroidales bacterium]
MSFIKVKKVIDMLIDAGFYFKSQRGSHLKYEHSDGRTVIAPNHNSKGIEKEPITTF